MSNLIPKGVHISDDRQGNKSTTVLFGVGASRAEADRSEQYELSTDVCDEQYHEAIEALARAHGRRYRHYWGDAIRGDDQPSRLRIDADDEGNTMTIAVGA